MKSGTPDHEKRCPYCTDSDWVRRSRSCWYDVPLLLLGFRPYRCMICFRRFHAFGRCRNSIKAAL
jgi:DNA-directed RNA polymerase subunit RPC12/RpoP